MDWKIAFKDGFAAEDNYKTVEEIENAGLQIIKGTVPGTFLGDLVASGLEKEFFCSDNIVNIKKYDNYNVWYFGRLQAFNHAYIEFQGIDSVSEIYVNGILTLKTRNRFERYIVSENLVDGDNEIVIHIYPSNTENPREPGRTLGSVSFSGILPYANTCGLW